MIQQVIESPWNGLWKIVWNKPAEWIGKHFKISIYGSCLFLRWVIFITWGGCWLIHFFNKCRTFSLKVRGRKKWKEKKSCIERNWISTSQKNSTRKRWFRSTRSYWSRGLWRGKSNIYHVLISSPRTVPDPATVDLFGKNAAIFWDFYLLLKINFAIF